MDELIDKYIEMFEELPPRLKMTNYGNKIYLNLISEAIERKSPLTFDEVAKAFRNIPYDVDYTEDLAATEEDEARQLFFGKEEVYNG